MMYAHSLTLPWSISVEDERRFRKVLSVVLLLTIALGIAIPLLPVLQKSVQQEAELPPRVAKLVFEKRVEPKPEPKPKPVEKPVEPKPEAVKQPQPKPPAPTKTVEKTPVKQPPVDALEQARKKASTAGLLAMQDALADLRDQSVDELKGSSRLDNNGAQAKKTERALITSKLGNGSAGINTSSMSRSAGSSQLAARTATEVKSSIAPPPAKTHTSRSASRSEEDIQVVFDRNKSVIFNIYNRALRTEPSLQGRLVVELTISPAGEVTAIRLVTSELGDDTLERKLLARIKLINFGAKPVEAMTINFPIDFLPA